MTLLLSLLVSFTPSLHAQTVKRPDFHASAVPVLVAGPLSTGPVALPARRPGAPLVAAPRDPEREKASRGFMKSFFGGEWYASWGYSKQWWADTDLHVSQPSLGNDFTIHGLQAHDSPGWDTGIFNKQPTVPQYSIRVGRFVDKKRTLAVELNWDHTKYTSTQGQRARVSGVIDGKPVDEVMTLDKDTFWYNLHNGANHCMINVVKRLPIVGDPGHGFSVSGIAKAGAGIMLPHADNAVFGNELDLGEKAPGNWLGKDHGWWQLDGWTAGLEAGVRVTPWHPVYLEFTDKLAYSRMSGVPVHQGEADHDLWMNQLQLSLGLTMGAKRRSALPRD